MAIAWNTGYILSLLIIGRRMRRSGHVGGAVPVGPDVAAGGQRQALFAHAGAAWNPLDRLSVAIPFIIIGKQFPGSFFHFSSNHLPAFTPLFELLFDVAIAFSIPVLA
jgi:hypothetical protein